MKRSVAFLTLFSFYACGVEEDPLRNPPPAQQPDNTWKNYLRSTAADDEVSALAILDDGSIAVAGYERGVSGDRLDPGGNARAFLTIHALNGDLIREVLLDTNGAETIDALVPDPLSSDLFVVGRTTGALEGQTNQGQYDLFAGVIDPAGTKAAKYTQFGTEYPQHARRAIADDTGDILVAGLDDIYVPTNYVDRWTDPLVARFDVDRDAGSTPSYEWYRTRETLHGDSYSGIAYDSADGSFYFSATSELGPGAYVEKRDRYDSVVWTTAISNLKVDVATDLAVAKDGHLLVSGATFLPLGDEKQYGQQDVFVVKLDKVTGEILWTALAGSEGSDFPLNLVVDARGHIFLAGETMGSVLPNAFKGEFDAFVIELDENGNWLSAFQYGTEKEERASAIVVESSGRVLIGGYQVTDQERDAFVVEAKMKAIEAIIY